MLTQHTAQNRMACGESVTIPIRMRQERKRVCLVAIWKKNTTSQTYDTSKHAYRTMCIPFASIKMFAFCCSTRSHVIAFRLVSERDRDINNENMCTHSWKCARFIFDIVWIFPLHFFFSRSFSSDSWSMATPHSREHIVRALFVFPRQSFQCWLVLVWVGTWNGETLEWNVKYVLIICKSCVWHSCAHLNGQCDVVASFKRSLKWRLEFCQHVLLRLLSYILIPFNFANKMFSARFLSKQYCVLCVRHRTEKSHNNKK